MKAQRYLHPDRHLDQAIENDDMNVRCLGARVIGLNVAREIVVSFLDASFSGEERHQRRLDKVLGFESLYQDHRDPWMFGVFALLKQPSDLLAVEKALAAAA